MKGSSSFKRGLLLTPYKDHLLMDKTLPGREGEGVHSPELRPPQRGPKGIAQRALTVFGDGAPDLVLSLVDASPEMGLYVAFCDAFGNPC